MEPHDASQGASPGARELDLLHHSRDILAEIGLDGRLLYASDATRRILARTPESFVGLSFMEIVAPEDRAKALAAFQKVIATGADALVCVRVPRADGLRVELEVAVRTFEGEHGVRRITASCRDVTERSAEGAIDRLRSSYHRAIAEHGPHPAAIVNRRGAILYSNRRFQRLFGRRDRLDLALDIGRTPSQEAAINTWQLSMLGDGAGQADFDFTEPDGETRWLSATWHALPSESDDPRFSVVYQDITQRKAIEQALQSLVADASYRGTDSARELIPLFARALEVDRIVFALLDTHDAPGAAGDASPDSHPDGGAVPRAPSRHERASVVAAWADGRLLEIDSLELAGLPDAAVARGETCIHPAGLRQLMPGSEHVLREGFESYAGIPVAPETGRIAGFVSVYARRPIHDTHLVRTLLGMLAHHFGTRLQRARADEEIRANQDRFEALARDTFDVLAEVGEDGRISYVSDASRLVLGYRPEELVGRSYEQLLHPDDASLQPSLSSAIEDVRPYSTANLRRVRHADGSWRWLESRTSPYTAADGSRRVVALCRDVTREHHEELGRDLLYHVVQQGSDLVAVCEEDTTLLYANAVATRLLGSAKEGSVEGRTLHDLLEPASREALGEEVLPAIARTGAWSGELELTRPDGQGVLTTEATIVRFDSLAGIGRPFLAATLRDVTERRATQAALRETESRLAQVQKLDAVGRLAGGIAHDFNNLLTAIIGYGDLMLEELGPEHPARRDAEEILSAAERAGGLTRQLLAFSRHQVLQPERLDLNAVVTDIDRLLRRLIGEDIEIVTALDGSVGPVHADPSQLEQVIVNLVVNARDAMPHGGRLEIETHAVEITTSLGTRSGLLEAGCYVMLRVSDSGVGMDDETLERIFEPFFTTKTPDQGTGLGLATVYGIVSQSGGQIDVESGPESGTTFRIYFPTADTLTATETSSDAVQIASRGDETILVVEDAVSVRTLIQRTLEAHGYQVLSAESGTGAARHCSRHPGPIHLLLTDVVLPKLDGPRIAQRARESRSDLRVLYMSGFSDEQLQRRGLGPDDQRRLLSKPFTPTALLHAVRAALDA